MSVLKIAPERANAPELIEQIETLSALIESGQVVGFVAVGICRDGGTHIFTCGPDVPLLSSVGASAILHHHLLAKVREV